MDDTTTVDESTSQSRSHRRPDSRRLPSRLRALCVSATVAVMVSYTPLSTAASGVNLLPHVSRYKLTLKHADLDSGITAVKGSMEVRLEISCDGFRVEQYLGFHLLGEDAAQLEHLAYIASFEDSDGGEFWFNTKTYENRKLIEEIGGQATAGSSGGGSARYTRPSKAVEPLPEGTLFPIKHMKAIISAARKGQKNLRHTVFDGSTRENPFEISTFIGAAHQGSGKNIKALEETPYWPVRLAYFSVGAVELTPQFQMSADLYDNGVIGNMIYDYGNFAIGVELDDVEALPKPEC